MLQILSAVFAFVSIALLVLMFLKVIFFLSLSSRHHRLNRRQQPLRADFRPMVSVLVPCYNEGPTVENCLNSLLDQSYDHYEVILVDDGSSDDTRQIIEGLAARHQRVRAFSKPNGGKATALNFAMRQAKGEIIVCMDADSIFIPSTLAKLVASFQDPSVVGVGGNVRVVNRRQTMGRYQAIEYITGLAIQRRAFSYLGCMQVISGAIGAFRKDVLLAMGGYATDTIVEDMDMTIELARRRRKTVYNPEAIAYTEAPEDIGDFLKQRIRWTYGGFQVAAKHRDLLFRRRFSRMGTVGLPYFVIFPWVDVVVSLLMVVSLVRAILTGDGLGLLAFFVIMSLIQAAIVMYALILDRQSKRLALVAGLDNLYYNHLITYATLKAGLDYIRRKNQGWNKVKRLGRNTLASQTAD